MFGIYYLKLELDRIKRTFLALRLILDSGLSKFYIKRLKPGFPTLYKIFLL